MNLNGIRRAGRYAVLAGLGVALLLVPASVALAGYQEGSYAGTTDQGEPVSFRVGEERLKRLNVDIYAECEEGPRHKVTVEAGRTRMDGGRFSLDLEGADALTVSITGKLRDRTATGQLKATLKPAGTICTATSTWEARLVPPDGAGLKP